MESHQSISEGWEDVADDNLSVISVPWSDTDARAASPPSPSSTPAVSESAGQTKSELTLPVQSTNRQSTAKHSDSTSRTRALHANDGVNVHLDKGEAKATNPEAEPLEDPFRDPPDTDDVDADEVSHNPAYDVDPRLLENTLSSLGGILDDNIRILTHLPARSSASDKSLRLCQRLRRRVSELQPLVSGYAQRSSSAAPRQLSLAMYPDLQGWLSDARASALALQTEAPRMVQGPVLTDFDSMLALSEIWMGLRGYAKKIGEVLAVVRGDLDEVGTNQASSATLPNQESLPISTGITFPARSEPIDIP